MILLRLHAIDVPGRLFVSLADVFQQCYVDSAIFFPLTPTVIRHTHTHTHTLGPTQSARPRVRRLLPDTEPSHRDAEQ